MKLIDTENRLEKQVLGWAKWVKEVEKHKLPDRK